MPRQAREKAIGVFWIEERCHGMPYRVIACVLVFVSVDLRAVGIINLEARHVNSGGGERSRRIRSRVDRETGSGYVTQMKESHRALDPVKF